MRLAMMARTQVVAALVFPFLLASCGGGGGGRTSEEVAGTAAVGEPVAGAQLNLSCASGSRSVTSGADGRYRFTLGADAKAPCVMVLSGGTVGGKANTEVMASVVTGSSGVVNVTPWTHLVTAKVLGGNPANTLQAMTPGEIGTALTPEKIAAAKTFVQGELAKLLGAEPPDELDPVSTPFTATPGNGMDDLLVSVQAGLAASGKSLSQAAQEVTGAGLQVSNIPQACKAGVLTGFTGRYDDVKVQVPYTPTSSSSSGGGGDGVNGSPGGGGSVGGGSGAGVGGSLGQFLHAKVEVTKADGSLLGSALTDDNKGMITVVPCAYRGPVRITIKGERADATYYDEARKANVPFTGKSMCAVVSQVSKNIGVTPLTNAACAYVDELTKNSASSPKWADAALIDKANQTVRDQYNNNAGPNFRLEDVTTLPVVLNQARDQQAGVLPNNPHGIYAATLSGLVQSAGRYRTDATAPGLLFTEQFSSDLTDGVLDHRTAALQSPFASLPSYSVDQLNYQANFDTSVTATRLGDSQLIGVGRSVTKRVQGRLNYDPSVDERTTGDAGFFSASVTLSSDGSIVVKYKTQKNGAVITLLGPAGQKFVDIVLNEGYGLGDPRYGGYFVQSSGTVTALDSEGRVWGTWDRTNTNQLIWSQDSEKGKLQISRSGAIANEEARTFNPIIPGSMASEFKTLKLAYIPDIAGESHRDYTFIDIDRGVWHYTAGGGPDDLDTTLFKITSLDGIRVKTITEKMRVVLDMDGQLWGSGGESVFSEGNLRNYRSYSIAGDDASGDYRKAKTIGKACWLYKNLAVTCDGLLYSWSDATAPFALKSTLFPYLAQTWRVSDGGTDGDTYSVGGTLLNGSRIALARNGCAYEIKMTYLSGGGIDEKFIWMVRALNEPAGSCAQAGLGNGYVEVYRTP